MKGESADMGARSRTQEEMKREEVARRRIAFKRGGFHCLFFPVTSKGSNFSAYSIRQTSTPADTPPKKKTGNGEPDKLADKLSKAFDERRTSQGTGGAAMALSTFSQSSPTATKDMA